MTRPSLRDGFLASVERFGDRPALVVGDAQLSYRELDRRARAVAATLDRHAQDDGKLTAVFGHRHPTTFAAILGALMRGHGYVPLNPAFPTERSRWMLARSRARALVVDPTAVDQIDGLLCDLPALTLLVPDQVEIDALRERWPTHTILGARDLATPDECVLGDVRPDDIAYLLFTSGSSGLPKGVMVAHRNVTAFLDVVLERYAFDERDRFSSTFDLTFDLSVFDLCAAWGSGACVYIPTAKQKLFPRKYIAENELTVWFGVPSTGAMMSRLKMLAPGEYPSLRWVLFCGEALPVKVIERFAQAAPNATLENLYGPTELTIACTHYRWDRTRSRRECENGIVPIGEPFRGMEVKIVDPALRTLAPGEAGELSMTGPQLALGYWEDQARTAAAFVVPPGDKRTFYRTGDGVRWPRPGPMTYLGRIDNQIKIQGYRVELGEIEAVLRQVSGADAAVALGWPRTASGANGVVAFVGAPHADAEAIRAAARARLPAYMQPSRVVLVASFPLNANGKIDRRALALSLEEDAS
jgi:amino acid adenylation domain-containing protein